MTGWRPEQIVRKVHTVEPLFLCFFDRGLWLVPLLLAMPLSPDKGSHIAFAYVMNMPGESVESSDLRRQEQLTEALTTYPDLPPMNALEPLSALDASGQPIAVVPAPTTTALPLPTTAPVSSDSTDPDSGGTDTDTAGDDIEGEQTNGESAYSSTTSP